MGLTFKDAGSADRQQVEEALNRTLSDLLVKAEPQGINYICLMSQPGDHPVHLYVLSALADLELSQTNSAVTVLFYRGGIQSLKPVQYSVGTPPAGTAMVSMTFKKISAPKGITTLGWIYFNLSRVQAEAEKAGSKVLFLKSSGTGASKPVAIPGLKETILAFDDNATLTASWAMDPATAAAHRAPAAP